jgi:hypothetical protein
MIRNHPKTIEKPLRPTVIEQVEDTAQQLKETGHPKPLRVTQIR